MAVVWEKTLGERRYRVTRAGASTRLYTNGVFHSQYNPRQPIAGNLWDVLFVPAFMHPRPRALQRVLVLGVGGGAVIQQLNVFLQPDVVVGVDLDKTHLQIARRFFHVNQPNVELMHAEARGWLESYSGEPFDLIIEDLFVDDRFIDEKRGSGYADPIRAIPAGDEWLHLLSRNLTRDGVLIMNFESTRSLSKSHYRNLLGHKNEFATAYRFSCSRYENAIGVFLRKPLENGQFVSSLREFSALDRRRNTCRLQFDYRKL